MELSEEKLKELKKNAIEILSARRSRILMQWPFIGSILMRLDIIPVRDIRVRTAQTDGSRIFFDLDFLSKLTKDQAEFVLAHEVWHVVMMHFLRLQNRDRTLWNIATDKEINKLISDDGLVAPPEVLFPEGNEIGKSAEQIYELLLKDIKNKKKGKESNSSSENSKGNGNVSGQFDKHMYQEDSYEGEDGNGKGEKSSFGITDKWGEVGFDKDYVPSIEKGIADKIRESVVSAAQSYERMKGDLPGHIKRIVDGIVKPEISWKEVLAKFVTSSFHEGEHRWIPPSRRHVYRDLYLPSKYSEKINVTVAIDTSGSTSGDLPKFFSEITSLLSSFGSYRMNVIQCDASVSSCIEYDSENNPFDFKMEDFEFEGGGGTDFRPVFDYIYDNQIETNCLVFFTDGYGTAPNFPPNYPVLWIVVKDGALDFCDWGTKVYFKNVA